MTTKKKKESTIVPLRLLKDVGASENFSYDGKNYRLAGYLPNGSAECIELNELGGGVLRVNLPGDTQVI